MYWIIKRGIISAEGKIEYDDGLTEKKVVEEFQKTIKYFDSIPILYGTEHPDFFTLEEIIGKANNFKIENGKWYADFNFDMEKIPDELLENLKKNKKIPASLSAFMDVDDDGVQRNTTPIHLLIHPNLDARVENTGLCIRPEELYTMYAVCDLDTGESFFVVNAYPLSNEVQLRDIVPEVQNNAQETDSSFKVYIGDD